MKSLGVCHSAVPICVLPISAVVIGFVPDVKAQPSPVPTDQGLIRGELIYPSDILAAQRVCAVHQKTDEETCIETAQSQAQYSLPVQSGAYQVYAIACERFYDTAKICMDGYREFRAYYNTFVECGLTYHCSQQTKDNTPIWVKVPVGQTIDGVNPQDWYTQ